MSFSPAGGQRSELLSSGAAGWLSSPRVSFAGASVGEHHQNRPGEASAGHPLHRHRGPCVRRGRWTEPDRRREDQ